MTTAQQPDPDSVTRIYVRGRSMPPTMERVGPGVFRVRGRSGRLGPFVVDDGTELEPPKKHGETWLDTPAWRDVVRTAWHFGFRLLALRFLVWALLPWTRRWWRT